MYKKIGVLLFAFVLILFIGEQKVKAENSTKINDYLNYLSENEISQLQESIDGLVKDYQLDVAIVITEDIGGKSSQAYADDFYDYNGYGVDSEYSGLLMLINMKDRIVTISTTGRAIELFTDPRIDTMISNVTKYLSDGKYYEASNTFINDIKYYADQGVSTDKGISTDKEIPIGQNKDKSDSISYSYFDKVKKLIMYLPLYGVALVISLVITIIISISSKGKVTINNQTYEEGGSFVLTNTTDQFIRESTTRTVIQSSSSSGGNSSSTHIGSSGRSHGGGSGRF